MALANVTLKVRIRLSDGTRKYVNPAYTKNRKALKQDWVVIGKAEQRHPGGVYTCRERQGGHNIYTSLGLDAEEALVAYHKIRAARESAALERKSAVQAKPELAIVRHLAPGSIPDPIFAPVGELLLPIGIPAATSPGKGRLLHECIAEYLKEKEQHKAKKSFDKYRSNLEIFAQFWPLQYVERVKAGLPEAERDSLTPRQRAALGERANAAYLAIGIEEVTRQHLLDFALYSRVVRRNSPRTVCERILNFQLFLHHFGLPSLLTKKKGDLPKYTKKKVRQFNKVFLQRMFDAADQDEYEFLHFYLGVGLRAAEGAYACYPDIDYVTGHYTVTEHLDLGFTPKDSEEGTFPITRFLTDLIAARRARYPGNRLIFPGKRGKPNLHILRVIKQLGLRAGVNCGFCVNEKGQSCVTHPICKIVILHTMRKTYASMLHADGVPARTIQRYLRHSDLETTLGYLADNEDDEQIRTKMENVFGQFSRST